MAVDDLPLPVVNFLNVIGVPWPYIDEDAVVRFADLTRSFAQAVENTHADATRTIAAIADAHQGASTQAMSSGWSTMSSKHVYEVVDACHVLAGALDVAAGYIGQPVDQNGKPKSRDETHIPAEYVGPWPAWPQ